jgi:hypothetical protein
MFRTLLTLFFVLRITVFSFAQKSCADTGKVLLVQEYKIKQLLNNHIDINSKAPIKGYRIKIHFGPEKNKAKEIKAKFISKFPDIPAYEKYDQPNFNIRVGDFRTKLEAYKFLKEVQIDFPSSFLVQDNIEMPELKQPNNK